MIDILYLANFLQDELNKNTLGKEFRIFASEGDLIQSVKVNNKLRVYDQGIVRVVSSNIVPIKNINFETINAQLMLLADIQRNSVSLEGSAEDRPQSTNLLDVKQCVAEVISRVNGQTVNINLGGKSYALTVGLSLPTEGEKQGLGQIADAVPLYISVSFVFFENGVNANDCEIYINGENMYFTRATVTRIKTADTNTFANSKVNKGVALVGGKSVDLVVPVLSSEVSQIIMEDVLDDTKINRAVNVLVKTPLAEIEFIGLLGNTTLNLESGLNAGYNVSVIQGIEDALVYDDNWTVREQTKVIETVNMTNAGTIYWGDGTITKVEKAQTVNHTYAGLGNIIRIFGGK